MVGKRQSFSQTTFKINTSANINYDSKEKITHDFFRNLKNRNLRSLLAYNIWQTRKNIKKKVRVFLNAIILCRQKVLQKPQTQCAQKKYKIHPLM